MDRVTVVGAGLSGVEAAWQLALRGIPVDLVEMRPLRMTPAHTTEGLAELVCSNSLRSDNPEVAVGLLKSELRLLGSVAMAVADRVRVPAGDALAVDRERFSRELTELVTSHPLISLRREEVLEVPDAGVLCPGPLVSEALARALSQLVGSEHLAFYDAIAPIVDGDSLDMSLLFSQSRYGKGGGDDYLNAPMTRDQYFAFLEALTSADRIDGHDFDKAEDLPHFAGCQPIEAIAATGPMALAFGPMKPVGLEPPDGSRPFAVVQLRSENLEKTAFNLVGFQTRMRQAAQRRVLRMIPGLEQAEFLRYGSIHRNTFLDSPRVLDSSLRIKARPAVRVGGQLSGSEGYVESVATGFLAALSLAAELEGKSWEDLMPPPQTALGAMLAYVTGHPSRPFQPSNMHFGLMPPIRGRGRKERRGKASALALETIRTWKASSGLSWPEA